jgi:hypothetical protein
MARNPNPPPMRFQAGILFDPSSACRVTRSGVRWVAMRGTFSLGTFASEGEAWRAVVLDARRRGWIVPQDVLLSIADWLRRPET